MHDSSRDLAVSEADVYKGPPVAHPSVLRSDWRGVRSLLMSIIFGSETWMSLSNPQICKGVSLCNQRLWMIVY